MEKACHRVLVIKDQERSDPAFHSLSNYAVRVSLCEEAINLRFVSSSKLFLLLVLPPGSHSSA